MGHQGPVPRPEVAVGVAVELRDVAVVGGDDGAIVITWAHLNDREISGKANRIEAWIVRDSVRDSWASRLTLEVTEVRVERLQDISEEDAQAEGGDPCRYATEDNGHLTHPYRRGFRRQWDQAPHGKRAPWASNPWVWAITFKVVP